MPVPYFIPPGYRFRPPWYARPQFCVPLGIAAVLFIGFAVYVAILASDLKSQAATFDLSKLEQMESASLILDRNDKIFGQIYVENRETVPYDQLPRDLVNAVVAVEDAKFYQHGGYDFFGIIRAALKNLDRKSTRLNSSHRCISYAVFCLKKKRSEERFSRNGEAELVCILLLEKRTHIVIDLGRLVLLISFELRVGLVLIFPGVFEFRHPR